MVNDIKKPTPEQIELWVRGLLSDDEMEEVATGLLLFKDEQTQNQLQTSISNAIKRKKSSQSNLQWVQQTLTSIFQEYKKSYQDMALSFGTSVGKPTPLYLGSEDEKIVDDNPQQEIEYSISAQSSSDFKLFIRLPKGKYLVTAIFANSKQELGFIYPDIEEISTASDLVIEGDTSFPIINDDYELQESEINFIIARSLATEKHLQYLWSCTQELEEIGVIRWLRYIEQNREGDFSVANLKFYRKGDNS